MNFIQHPYEPFEFAHWIKKEKKQIEEDLKIPERSLALQPLLEKLFKEQRSFFKTPVPVFGAYGRHPTYRFSHLETKNLKKIDGAFYTSDVHFSSNWVPTEEEIQDLFTEVKNLPCIPWEYKRDGCYARCYMAGLFLLASGVESSQISKQYFFGPIDYVIEKDTKQRWNFHVALKVKDQSGEEWIFDPTIHASAALQVDEWEAALRKISENGAGLLMASSFLEIAEFDAGLDKYVRKDFSEEDQKKYLHDLWKCKLYEELESFPRLKALLLHYFPFEVVFVDKDDKETKRFKRIFRKIQFFNVQLEIIPTAKEIGKIDPRQIHSPNEKNAILKELQLFKEKMESLKLTSEQRKELSQQIAQKIESISSLTFDLKVLEKKNIEERIRQLQNEPASEEIELQIGFYKNKLKNL